jgi:hypothetical protein
MINETHAAVAPDGFNVPSNFAEFQERYPTFIRDVFRRRSFVDLTIASVNDLTSGGALWMATLISVMTHKGGIDSVTFIKMR